MGMRMKMILDTHVFLLAISDPKKMNKKRREEIERPTNIVYLSSISVAELMIKASIGKLKIDFDPIDIAEKSGFELLDFTSEEALLLKNLPFHHKDPFDRMLIAQSIKNKYSIITDDNKFKNYQCKLV